MQSDDLNAQVRLNEDLYVFEVKYLQLMRRKAVGQKGKNYSKILLEKYKHQYS